MRGKTLEAILNKVRVKARLSLLPANNTQVTDSHKQLIRDEQERLWEDYAWPHLRVQLLVPLQAGQHEYAVPTTLTMDRIEHITVRDGGEWRKLRTQITEEDYSLHETALDERSWPIRAWQANDEDQIDVWPIPDQNADPTTLDGYMRVTGIRSLNTFVAEADTADLDDELIALYVAGGLLASTKAADAQLKLEAANKLYTKLKGKQTKGSTFNMFGTVQRRPVRRRMYVDRYVP